MKGNCDLGQGTRVQVVGLCPEAGFLGPGSKRGYECRGLHYVGGGGGVRLACQRQALARRLLIPSQQPFQADSLAAGPCGF